MKKPPLVEFKEMRIDVRNAREDFFKKIEELQELVGDDPTPDERRMLASSARLARIALEYLRR